MDAVQDNADHAQDELACADEAAESGNASLTAKKPASRLRIVGCAMCVVAVLIAVLLGASALLEPHYDGQEHKSERSKGYSVLFEKPDSLDVLFIGDSEAFGVFSPYALYRNEGFTSYVIGTGEQNLAYSELMLHKALDQQSTVKTVVIEMNACYTSFSKVAEIKQGLKNIFPVFEYHDRWKALLPWSGYAKRSVLWGDSQKGFRSNDHAQPADPDDVANHMAPTDEVDPIAEENKQVLVRMVQYCRDRGIEPLLVNSPSVTNWGMKQHNAVEAFVDEELHATYIDFNMPEYAQQINIDWQTDTLDEGNHVNFRGSAKMNAFFAPYVDELYDLPDHRGSEGYETWDAAAFDHKDRDATRGHRS